MAVSSRGAEVDPKRPGAGVTRLGRDTYSLAQLPCRQLAKTILSLTVQSTLEGSHLEEIAGVRNTIQL